MAQARKLGCDRHGAAVLLAAATHCEQLQVLVEQETVALGASGRH